jgi:hypothetical protein
VNQADAFITLPLKKDSDYLHVKDRYLADTWDIERKKMLNRITESYRKAPYFKETYEVIEKCILYEDRNLFKFILHSLQTLMQYLNIKTNLVISSSILVDHQLKSDAKVMAICKERGADMYINPIGGIVLYDKNHFKQNNLELQFQKSNSITYKQFNNDFLPWLSIIDVMMFNSKEEINKFLSEVTFK